MRVAHLLAAGLIPIAASRVVDKRQAVVEGPAPKLFTIETAPGVTQQVTEVEKWALKAQGKHFIDITDFANAPDVHINAILRPATYPTTLSHQELVKGLFPEFNKTNMEADLTIFSAFQNRYFNSSYGKDAAIWLQARVKEIISNSGADPAMVEMIDWQHGWLQSSTIARIHGKSNKTIVIGAHMDSINAHDFDPVNARAPGADDNGSGTVTLLEALRVLLTDPTIANGEQENTIEFHWYAAEEVGLLGSNHLFAIYKSRNMDIRAMLNQDMTGYVFKNQTEKMGVIVDFVDDSLTAFMRQIITGYCDIGFADIKCGYACSDHASALRTGYQSAFVSESDLEYNDIHDVKDVMSVLSFDHMIQHAKMVVGFAYELSTIAGL